MATIGNDVLAATAARERVRRIALALSLALGSVAATSAGARAEALGSLGGKVIDASSGAAIARATIGAAVPTDASSYAVPVATSRRDGSFSIVGIREDDVVVDVRAVGYRPAVCRYRLSPGGQTFLTFRLQASEPVNTGDAKPAIACPPAPVGGGQTQDVYVVR